MWLLFGKPGFQVFEALESLEKQAQGRGAVTRQDIYLTDKGDDVI